jgi:hypothetical protein
MAKEKGPNYDPSYAKYFDHTKLAPDATAQTISDFCSQALEYGFAAVCVNPCRVKLAAGLLRGSGVHTATVVGFPLGANTTAIKAAETAEAVENGADEVDMVINIGALKDGNWDYVRQDIQAVVDAEQPPIRAAALDFIIFLCNTAARPYGRAFAPAEAPAMVELQPFCCQVPFTTAPQLLPAPAFLSSPTLPEAEMVASGLY